MKRIAFLVPFDMQRIGGAQRHVALLKQALETHAGFCVDVFDAASARPASALIRRLSRAIAPLSHLDFADRVPAGPAFEGYAAVIGFDHGSAAATHPRNFWAMTGDYVAFRRAAVCVRGPLAKLRWAGLNALYGALTQAGIRRARPVPCSAGVRAAVPYARQCTAPIAVPVDTDLFRPGDQHAAQRHLGLSTDARYVLFCGRWEFAKGVDRLEALVHALPANWRLLLAGPRMADLPASLRARVALARELAFDEIPRVYQAADATVLPSRFEGAGLAVVESLACGTPAWVSPTGVGLDLAQDPVLHSLVVESPDDAQAWALALTTLSIPSARRDELARASRDYALTHHSLPAVAKRWALLLESSQ